MPLILFYDRDCRFCIWGVVGIARRCRPGTLELATIQGHVGEEHLAHLSRKHRLASWHLWDGERLRSEADVLDGLAPLLSSRGLRAGVEVARLLPRPAVAAVYRAVAAHRMAASKLVPSAWKRRAREDLGRFSIDPAGVDLHAE